MKRIISLAVVVAFFVTVPQCLGQSQDAEKDAAQLLTEQQLEQMFHLVMVQANMVDICHITAAADPIEGDGVVIAISMAALAVHCRHGDCSEFYSTANGINCVCGGQQIDLCELGQ